MFSSHSLLTDAHGDTVEKGVKLCNNLLKGRIIYYRHILKFSTMKACYEDHSETDVSGEFVFTLSLLSTQL
jgi:hypothetical protein